MNFFVKWLLSPILTYIVLPLTRDLFKWLAGKINDYFERRKIMKKAKEEGKKKIEKLKKAKESKDENNYNNAIDDI